MDAPRSTLLITYSPEVFDGVPILISSNCLPVKASKLEPVGHAFHAAALRLLGYEEEDGDKDDQSVKSDYKGQPYMPSSDSYSRKGKKKSANGSEQQDHYALLGLAHLRFLATEEQIRKSYRETALKHHPDKQASLLIAEVTEKAKQTKKDEIESHFKSIQEAYEILIDPVKRRIYDSTDEFDDKIPTDCAPQNFFKVFGPAFVRNGRWSVNTPVPSLGDDKSSLAEVDGFYNFWYGFKSWREFPHADEFDLEQAESRDHKRWMERQNAKLREKAKKEEHMRIRTLIDNAYKKDPRILRRKDEVKAEKQRKKDVKLLAKKLQEEEAARAVEEERRKKEDDDRRAAEAALNQRKQREKEKKLLRKEKARLRTLSSSVVLTKSLGVSDDDVEKLCTSLEIDQLKLICDRMEEDGSEKAQLLRSALGMGPVNPQQNGNVGLGSKMNGVVSSICEKQEVLNGITSNVVSFDVWSVVQEQVLVHALKTFPKEASQRWERVAAAVPGKNVNQCRKKFAMMGGSFRTTKNAHKDGTR